MNADSKRDLVFHSGMALLARYAEGPDVASTRHDPGPLLLAAAAASVGTVPAELRVRVTRRWLSECPERVFAFGAFGGLGGLLCGLRATRDWLDQEASGGLMDALAAEAPRWSRAAAWRTAAPAWADYDLFHGPAGLLLGGLEAGSDGTVFEPALEHLVTLFDTVALDRMRAGTEIDPRSAFNIGRINTGLGHGVTGVVAALVRVTECGTTTARGTTTEQLTAALRRGCDWLVGEAFEAGDGLITWPPVGRDDGPIPDRPDHRQAWCYGTPGVSFSLWLAGRVLGEEDLRLLGLEAMRSFCRVFDPNRHLDHHDPGEELGICHGAAGTLAVADAFATQAGLPEAVALREELDGYLRTRSAAIEVLAEQDMGMLTGAAGIAAIRLVAHGADRSWLPLLALR